VVDEIAQGDFEIVFEHAGLAGFRQGKMLSIVTRIQDKRF